MDSGIRGRGCDPLGDDTMNLIKKMRLPLFIIIVAIASLTGFTFFTEVSYSRMNNYGILMDAFNKTNAKFILGEVHINEKCNRIEEIYARFNIVPICISSISGEYQNVLSKDDTEKITSGLLRYIRATKVKSIITGNTLSVTGISPFFSNQSSIKDINFNLGVRSSAFEDKTYITLAT